MEAGKEGKERIIVFHSARKELIRQQQLNKELQDSLGLIEAKLRNFSLKEHQSCREDGAKKTEEQSISQNGGTAGSHDDVGDVNMNDDLKVSNSVEDAAQAVASGFFLEQVKKAADELLKRNHCDSLGMVTEAGSIPQAVLDRIEESLDAYEMLAAASKEPVDTSPYFGMCKNSLRQAALTYLSSKNTPERLEQHEVKIAFYRGTGSGPDPPAISLLHNKGFSSFNPLYDELWLPWAKRVQFIDHQELGMLLADRQAAAWGLQAKTLGMLFSSAIPSRQILEYMVQRAPKAKIAELGAGSGYWAALLQKLGADIVAVDNGSEEIYSRCLFFPARIKQDGTEFLISSGGADGRALFLCWPRDSLENPVVFSFLENYSGNTIFFVGKVEVGRTWAYDHQENGWEVEVMFDIPNWPGIHDAFLCISRKVAENQFKRTRRH